MDQEKRKEKRERKKQREKGTFSLQDGGIATVCEWAGFLAAETSEVEGIPAEVAMFSPARVD